MSMISEQMQDVRDELEKEKVMFPEIVVRGTNDKPYYEIKYYDVVDKQWHLGYGSYNLEYVKQWKEECLEIVEGSITNILCEKIKEQLEERKLYLLKNFILVDDKALEVKESSLARVNELDGAIVIVNQLQEEFATDTNVGNNDGWIPFTERENDEEEKEAYGCDMMLSCKLPEEDEEILVTYKNGYVDTDTFLRDGYECYLDSGAEFVTEAIAWMPKPKGYQPKGE